MSLAHLRFRVTWELRRFQDEYQDLGMFVSCQLLVSRILGSSALKRLSIPGYCYPVYIRPGTSDTLVLRQVIGQSEYDCVGHETNVRKILDLGGNVGLASFFLLHRYPKAQLVFVEPDSGNLAVARKTLAPFRHRVTFVQAGVWDSSVPLTVERGAYGDGGAWSFQVRPTKPGEVSDFLGVTVDDLLTQKGWKHVDLVKMDIEAAEAVVFDGSSAAPWVRRITTLAVELHGPDCDAAVTSAYAALPHHRSQMAQTTIIRLAS